jgi:galactokinase
MDILQLKDTFFQHFYKPEFQPKVYFAPGRVNLIGEHTDYNMGYVLPCALTYGTYLLIRENNDNALNMVSVNFEYQSEIPLDSINQKQGTEWVNYPLGVMAQLLNYGFVPRGMDMLYFGNIPNGAGLSSSASIEVVSAAAINELFGLGVGKVDLVKLSQKAENEFIGVNCGIMDQFAVGMGKKDHAIFLDCGTLDFELVPLELGEYRIVIANTNKQRGLADSKYNERVSECQSAVKYLNKAKSISALGELTYQEFIDSKHHIPDITTRKRAKHVVSENQRVLDAVIALKRNNMKLFGKLMNASHNSLRHDYEVTGVELDTLTELARGVEGVLGSRMTGAGFGGCTVSLVRADVIDGFIERVGFGYHEQTGLKAEFYISEIGDGVHKVK